MEKCIDISAWQGEVSVSTFQRNRSTIPYVIIRSSYTSQSGFNLHRDKWFDKNIVNAYKANLRGIGAYHYSQAVSETEAVKEAEFVIDVLKPYRPWITLPVAFDWEFGGRLNSTRAKRMGKQRCGQICDAFCRTIRNAGYVPMVYANLSTLTGYLPDDLYKRYKIWVAQYAKRCDYKHDAYMWQYTSGGSVPGISGRVDLNYLYKDETPRRQAITYAGKLPTLPSRGWFTSGDTGTQVKLLQVFLNWYFGYERLDVDGEVGRLTMDAVRDYERAEGLTVDGAFGSQCLKRAKMVRR